MAVKYTHIMKQETKYPKGYVKIEEVKAWHYTKTIVKVGSKPKDHWILNLNSSRLGNIVQSKDLGTWIRNPDGNQIRFTVQSELS